MITEEDVKKLLELEAKATEGPWECDGAHGREPDGSLSELATRAIYYRPTESQVIEVIESPDELNGECIHNENDHTFIAESRNMIKELCESWLEMRNELLEYDPEKYGSIIPLRPAKAIKVKKVSSSEEGEKS